MQFLVIHFRLIPCPPIVQGPPHVTCTHFYPLPTCSYSLPTCYIPYHILVHQQLSWQSPLLQKYCPTGPAHLSDKQTNKQMVCCSSSWHHLGVFNRTSSNGRFLCSKHAHSRWL